MFSIQDLNQKVILFAGRLSDSRKGLGLFLEAVEILTSLTGLPSFAIWIVGGSPREVCLVSSLIDSVNALHVLHREGRVRLWGRVENSALSEIYSRATVTVVPSHRDEFGIVAVEAMMCGSPVIAANTGGLPDVLADGQTGTLFEPDDALTLAATLSTYLRNPQQREVYGTAARLRAEALFSKRPTLKRVAQLYDPTFTSEICLQGFCSQEDGMLTPQRLSRLQSIFDTTDISISRSATGRHPVFHVERGESQFIAKFFTQRFSLQASLFPSPSPLSAARGGRISYSREIYNKDNPIAPAIQFFDESPEPVIVTEWIRQLEDVSETIDESISEALRMCQSYKPLPDCAELSAYIDSLNGFAQCRSKSNLERFDLASAKLNSRMTEGQSTLCRTHPQVELARFQWLINENVWPLPLEFRVRANQVMQLILKNQEIIVEAPLLAHGDPKPEHLLVGKSGQILIADFEHSRYTVGPADLALWFSFTGIRGRLDANAMDVCERVCKQCQTRKERYLCICWIVSEVIFFAVHRFSSGGRRELQVTHNFLRDLSMAILNSEIIQ